MAKALCVVVVMVIFSCPCRAQTYSSREFMRLNNVRYASCSLDENADAGAKIQAAIDDLPPTGGTVIADFEGG